MANEWKVFNGLNEDGLELHRAYGSESVEVDWLGGEVRVEVEDAHGQAAVYMDREAAERLRQFLNEKLGE